MYDLSNGSISSYLECLLTYISR